MFVRPNTKKIKNHAIIKDLSGETGIKLMDIMQLLPMLDELPETVPPEFPIEVFGKGEDMDAVLGSMTAQAQIGGGNSGGGGGVDAAAARSVGGGGGGRGRGRAAPDEYGSDDEDGGPTNAEMGGLSGQEKEASAGGTLLARKRFPTHTGISILIVSGHLTFTTEQSKHKLEVVGVVVVYCVRACVFFFKKRDRLRDFRQNVLSFFVFLFLLFIFLSLLTILKSY